jgi:hypothetical protein
VLASSFSGTQDRLIPLQIVKNLVHMLIDELSAFLLDQLSIFPYACVRRVESQLSNEGVGTE